MIEDVKIETPVLSATAPTDEPAGPEKVRGRRRLRVRRESISPPSSGFFQPLPLWVWLVSLGLAAFGAFSANPAVTPVAVLILPVLASLLWFPSEPPVLLFACGMQWLQAAVAIFYTDFYFQPFSAMPGGAELIEATWLSLIGVLVVAIGMRLALIRRRTGIARQLEHETRLLQPPAIFAWYLAAFVVFYFGGRFAWSFPSLAQPLLATMTLKWVLVFLLTYAVLVHRRNYALLGIVVCLEFFTGLLGFFSSFKNVFFVLIVVLPTARFVFRGWRLVQCCIVGALLLAFGVIWTVIKSDYREFLNQGTGQQTVLVPVPERIGKLSELISGLDRRSLDEGLEMMILRVSYISYFAMTLAHVPENVPHENGALWFGAIKHVLTPRLLFPNKPSIDDSARTEKYAGVQVSGAEQGTSISLGYVAESYIDFGLKGMFAPILILGLFYGLIYRFFADHQPYRVLGLAMATSILVFGAYSIETSNIKLVGGNLMSLIVIGLFSKIAGKWFWQGLTQQEVPHRRIRKSRKQRVES